MSTNITLGSKVFYDATMGPDVNEDFSFSRTALKGLVVILPVMAIGYTVYWTFRTLEAWLAKFVRLIFPEWFYFPGMGLLLGIFISFLVGLLMNTAFAQKLYGVWESLLQRIPLVKSVYGAVEDILGMFSTDKRKRYNRVVLIHLKENNMRLMGFVTKEDATSLAAGNLEADSVAVYLPMSYQIGGYMIFLPKSQLEPVDMTIEDASRLVLTAGMSSKKRDA